MSEFVDGMLDNPFRDKPCPKCSRMGRYQSCFDGECDPDVEKEEEK